MSATRSLSSAHPALAGRLLLRPVLLAWSAFAIADAVVQPYRAWIHYKATDWVGFVVGARVVPAGAAMYSHAAQEAAQAALLGGTSTVDIYANPPLFAFLLQPLAALPLRVSNAIWSAVLIASLATAVVVFAGLLPAWWGSGRRLAVSLVTVCPLPIIDAIYWGQLTPLVLPFVALAFRRLASTGDSVAAGCLLAVLLLKPQFAWLLPPVLAIIGWRRTMVGLVAGAAAWLATSVALLGPAGVWHWVAVFIPTAYAGGPYDGAGVPSVLAGWGLDPRVALALAAPLVAAVLVVMWRDRARWRRSPLLAVAVAIALSTLFSPHGYDRDIALVGLTLLLMARARTELAVGLAVVMGVAFLLDQGWAAPLHLVTVVSIVSLAIVLRAETVSDRAASRAAALAPVLGGVP